MPLVHQLSVLWEIPLGLLSYGFSRVVKATLTLISRYYNPTDTKVEADWQIVSADFLKSPVKLLWTMSRARWNLHALIAIAGPFTVQSTITLDVRSLWQSAPTWTAVVYTLKGYKTLTSISSLTVSPDQDTATIELPPGRYLVGLRHYDWRDPVQLPAIVVDGAPALASESRSAPPDFNQFYRGLAARRGLLFSALNFYVYPLLRWMQWLPRSFVKPTFLPVPNPETHFFYGALDRGEQLTLDLPAHLLDTHRLYFSLYSRDCFPYDWYPITQDHHTTDPMTEQGVYILRVHPKTPEMLGVVAPLVKFLRSRAQP
ncbi:DUF6208 family protein [Leptolyngbya sp. KIOST-1]|uniref:DUF6208 family protein n=1 Tax=Leptolyngbya sp. KIOST-1 TaxID=1229172 RepID=UPI00055EED3F|nr:DUF6208 family protein [Leptolyngbya sp. KIOST-1]